MTPASSSAAPATASSPPSPPRTCSPPPCPLSRLPSLGFPPLLLLGAGGDPLSQPPLGVQRQVGSSLCQACRLPGHSTLATAPGRGRLSEKKPLPSAQIASGNLFQIRYIISVITNPLTCAPSAGGTVSSAAWKGTTLSPVAETGGNRHVKRGFCSFLGTKLVLAARTPLCHAAFYCYLQEGKARRKMKTQRNCIFICIM